MLELERISKHHVSANARIDAVVDVSLTIDAGEVFGIVGYSGAGKSTLVKLMNLLERPSAGSVRLRGRDLTSLTPRELRHARQTIAMVFQQFNLIANRTVAANVAFPLEVARVPRAERDARVRECLATVGLSDKLDAWPATLSGGQKQRVAIARAIANRPSVLLCDEPTSALDPRSSGEVLDFLAKINRDLGTTIVIVTHQMAVVDRICDRVGVMEAGRLKETFRIGDARHRPATEIGRMLLALREGAAYDARGVSHGEHVHA